MRYRLRTLLILLAVLPPVLAVVAPKIVEWRQPAVTWNEATIVAGEVATHEILLITEDKNAGQGHSN